MHRRQILKLSALVAGYAAISPALLAAIRANTGTVGELTARACDYAVTQLETEKI